MRHMVLLFIFFNENVNKFTFCHNQVSKKLYKYSKLYKMKIKKEIDAADFVDVGGDEKLAFDLDIIFISALYITIYDML